MTKKRPRENEPNLFTANGPVNGSSRRRRALFLPRLLGEEARKETYRGAYEDQAYGIVKRWADLESDGYLDKKETARDAEFLHELFGKALGYRSSTESPGAYHLEREFAIPGVGSADAALGKFPLPRGGAPVAVSY